MDFDRHRTRADAGRPGLLGLLQRRVYLPALLLVPALAVGLGLLVPRAASSAATIVESAEVDNFLFQKSDDNLLGITDKVRELRLELSLDSDPGDDVPADPTEKQLNSLKAEAAATVKELYGWDLNSRTDRERIRDEVLLLGQMLHTIPDEYLALEDNEPLRELRNVVDGVEGTTECRDRCLPETRDAVVNRIVSVTVGASVNRMLSLYTDNPGWTQLVIFAVSVFVGSLTEFVFNVGPAITGIPLYTLRKSALSGAASMLILVNSYLKDARSLAGEDEGTVRRETEKAAEEVQAASGQSEVDPRDYNMINEEL